MFLWPSVYRSIYGFTARLFKKIINEFSWYSRMIHHYRDVIISAMASEITDVSIVYSTVYGRRSKKTLKLRVTAWPLWGEFTGDRWIPCTQGQWRGKCFHLMTSSWKSAISQILQCISHISHNTPLGTRNVHISVLMWCFVGYGPVHLGICRLVITSLFGSISKNHRWTISRCCLMVDCFKYQVQISVWGTHGHDWFSAIF